MVDVKKQYLESINEILKAIRTNEEELKVRRKEVQNEITKSAELMQEYASIRDESSSQFWKVGVYFLKGTVKRVVTKFFIEEDNEKLEEVIRPVETYLDAKSHLVELVNKNRLLKAEYSELTRKIQKLDNQATVLETIGMSD